MKRADTVVLGMGLATLHAVDGAIPLTLADRPGHHRGRRHHRRGHRRVAGAAAGRHEEWQQRQEHCCRNNPTTLSDVYFRVGGPYVGKADVALQVNSDNVLIDHTWVWRADHGIEGFDRH